MGMAASQARYLALVARKSNCEYEGQQINQARTVLSNQSANLFNQMLGLNVPVPPSTSDFTKQQYSYTDGINNFTLDSWQQLANPDENYNYVVTRYGYRDIYTGSQKKMNDPQVQFSGSIPSVDLAEYNLQIKAIEEAQRAITEAQKEYDELQAQYQTLLTKASKIETYADSSTNTYVLNHSFDTDTNTYTINMQAKTSEGYPIFTVNNNVTPTPAAGEETGGTTPAAGDETGGTTPTTGTTTTPTEIYLKNGKYYNKTDNSEYEGSLSDIKAKADTTPLTYKAYSELPDGTEKTKIANAIEQLKTYGALPKDFDSSKVYYDTTNQTIAFKSDIDSLIMTGGSQTGTILPVYHIDGTVPNDVSWTTLEGMNNDIMLAKGQLDAAKATLDIANATFDAMSIPEYIGNCKLDALSELSSDQLAAIRQIIADMKKENINSRFEDCFDTLDGTYSAENYKGGIYSFKLNGITYYATYFDLAESAASGDGINNIDHQEQMSYYNATYVKTKQEDTVRALLETDSNGRFTSVRFENDSVRYELNVETVTDDVAYKDAMNKYNYENALYDKMVQDINVKTSLIQQEDQQLELRLKQLDTEQNALSTEIDAVSKVVKDNVEKSFKTFGG